MMGKTKRVIIIVIVITISYYNLHAFNTKEKQEYTLQMCIDKALQLNSELKESAKEVDIYRSKLEEANAAFFPKFDILTYIAPTYEMKGDILNYEKNYNKLGPYYHLKMEVTMPIYTFGKVEYYKKAAKNGIIYAQNKKLEKKSEIVLDIKKYYYGYILANKLSKLLDDIKGTLNDAIEKAEKIYNSGTGEVKKSDLEKLKVYMAEVKINETKVNKLIRLARLALFFKMGLNATNTIEIKIIQLKPVAVKLNSLDFYIKMSMKNNPQMKQILAGLNAKRALVSVERSSFYPIFFVAGQINYNWSPVIDDQTSPWVNDPYNGLDGGVAIGAKYYFDYKTIKAKLNRAKADYEKLQMKHEFAKKGIELQVEQKYMEVMETKKYIDFTKEELKAANSWMRSAGLLYAVGTGDAKDALEGLAAYAIAKQKYYTSIYEYNIKVAELFKMSGIVN